MFYEEDYLDFVAATAALNVIAATSPLEFTVHYISKVQSDQRVHVVYWLVP